MTKSVEEQVAATDAATKLAAAQQAEMDRIAAEVKAMEEKLAVAAKAKADADAAKVAAEAAATTARTSLGELLEEKKQTVEQLELMEASYGG